ncbi:MAG: leucine-rich repeat protein [Clostridia bacterium]|nr:leucine-rich repeat protein [Clostridia bacterium]
MKNRFKKTVSAIVALLMIAALLPAGFAASALDDVDDDKCGENLTWSLDDGVLTISGSGAMDDFMFGGPWGYSPTAVVIEEGVTSIGENAFYQNSYLNSVSIPSTVAGIGEDAFYKCSGLESITVASGNKNYRSAGGCLIETKTGTLLTAAQGFTIPDDGSVTAIADDAFAYFEWLTDPSLPDSITSIGDCAFDRTGFHENDDNWKDGALYLGKWLIDTETSDLPDPFEIKAGTVGLASKSVMFYKYSDVVLPEGLKYVGAYAFQSAKLTSLTLPSSVEVIEEWAFGYCSRITSVTIPASVRELGEYAFYACNALGGITFNEGLKSIGKCAFYTSGNYGKPTIPFSVGFIGLHAFNEDTTLRVYEYSYALRHAIENEISYELLPHDPVAVKGDFDGDGEISVADALAALRIAAKLVAETPEAVETGDTDGDGHVTVADALAILRVAAKLIESL